MQMSSEPLAIYRALPMEAAELASMSTELIGHNFFESCFTAEQSKTALRDNYAGIVLFLCYMAQVDAFQHWVYEHPGHTPEERSAQWSELSDTFGPPIDWSEIEEFKGIYWQQQGHIIGAPFYYIDYGIAQLGALQVEANFKQDPISTLKAFKEALALGASRPLPEIYKTAGIRFDFSAGTVGPVAERLAELAS
jgi:oligoendopeptidase F